MELPRFRIRPATIHCLALLTWGAAGPAGAQQPEASLALQGQVVSSISGQPVPLTIIQTEAGQQALSDENGRFKLQGLAPGTLQLQLRNLGYATADTTIPVTMGATPLTLQITPQPVELSALEVQGSAGTCRTGGFTDAAATAAVVTLLSNARTSIDRYHLLREKYPYDLMLSRTRQYLKPNGEVAGAKTDSVTWSHTDSVEYTPGHYLKGSAETSYTFGIPSADVLAIPAFQQAHCFRYAAIDTVGSDEAYRVDFIPTQNIQGPDLAGSVYLDRRSLLPRRIAFRLVNLPKGLHFSDVRTVVDYAEIQPGLVVPNEIHVRQTLHNVVFAGSDVTTSTKDFKLIQQLFIGPAPGDRPPGKSPGLFHLDRRS